MEGFMILVALLAIPLTIGVIFGGVWVMAMSILIIGEVLDWIGKLFE
jgi:hypothetical protein